MSHFFETFSLRNIIVVGDLSIVFDPNEKKGGFRGKNPLQEFVESLIHSWDLLDFKPKKGLFTLSNNRIGAANILAHLD